jgi:hypothetical protein
MPATSASAPDIMSASANRAGCITTAAAMMPAAHPVA